MREKISKIWMCQIPEETFFWIIKQPYFNVVKKHDITLGKGLLDSMGFNGSFCELLGYDWLNITFRNVEHFKIFEHIKLKNWISYLSKLYDKETELNFELKNTNYQNHDL